MFAGRAQIMVTFTIRHYIARGDGMRLKLLMVLTALAIILTSCGSGGLPRMEVSAYTEKTVETDIRLQMDIDCENGSTEIYRWNRNEVKLEITEIVRGNETKSALLKRLEDFSIDIEKEAGKLALKCRFRGGSKKVEGLLNLKLYIPKKTSSFSLTQKNGRLSFLDDFDGDININAGKLDLDINRLEGKLTCKLESGDLKVSSGELESGSGALIGKGNIRIKAFFEDSGAYSFKTGFGILELRLPEGANVVFDAYGPLEAGDFAAGEHPSRFRLESRLGRISVLKF
jgi:hypothetical protein